jgi:hypothetical protein
MVFAGSRIVQTGARSECTNVRTSSSVLKLSRNGSATCEITCKMWGTEAECETVASVKWQLVTKRARSSTKRWSLTDTAQSSICGCVALQRSGRIESHTVRSSTPSNARRAMPSANQILFRVKAGAKCRTRMSAREYEYHVRTRLWYARSSSICRSASNSKRMSSFLSAGWCGSI